MRFGSESRRVLCRDPGLNDYGGRGGWNQTFLRLVNDRKNKSGFGFENGDWLRLLFLNSSDDGGRTELTQIPSRQQVGTRRGWPAAGWRGITALLGRGNILLSDTEQGRMERSWMRKRERNGVWLQSQTPLTSVSPGAGPRGLCHGVLL